MASSPQADLVAAWEAWDRWCSLPSHRRRHADSGRPQVARLTSALIGVADELGCSHMRLRDGIAEGRRAGLSVEDAVSNALTTNALPESGF